MNQPQYKEQEDSNATKITRTTLEACHHEVESHRSQGSNPSPSNADRWKTANMLDSANNRLQELMQLFYLLSRDPCVPSDARYHVTVAQGEIALLSRQLQNAANEALGKALPPAEDKGLRPSNP